MKIHRFHGEDLELGFDADSGSLCLLGPRGSRENWISHGLQRRTLDVRLAGGWIGESEPPRLQEQSVRGAPEGTEIAITASLGPLTVKELYRINGFRIRRRVTLENRGGKQRQITGLRLAVAGVCVGAPEHCVFEAPGTAVQPRLPLSVAAEHSLGDPPSERFAPGARDRWGMAMETAPDCSPGLLAVYNSELRQALLCWYYSEVEEALPAVDGSGQGLSLIHDVSLAAWLAPGHSLTAGDQYLQVCAGPWPEVLLQYRASSAQIAPHSPLYNLPRWVEQAAIYEVHAGQFGGFQGLGRELERIRAMGFDTIYLLPIQRYHNPHGRLWDENWKAGGSPYAIRDFEEIDPSLGSGRDFRALVKQVHSLGMRLLLDFVPQGCALDARYVEEHPGWFCRDEEGGLVSSRGWNDTYSFDWANPEYQRYMLEWSLGWMRRYRFDGYRVDAPLAKEPNWDRRIPYRAGATNLGVLRLLEELQRGVKEIDPQAVLLCELCGPLFTRTHDMACDYLSCIQTYQMLQARLSPARWSSWIRDHRLCLPEGAERVCFMETHDTREFRPPARPWRGSLASRAGFAALVLAGFIPMIWSGQEKGQEDFFRRVLGARAGSPALLRGEILFDSVLCSDPWVLNIMKRSDRQLVWGLVSLRPETATFAFSLPTRALGLAEDGTYYLKDLISGSVWSEYGKDRWNARELRALSLTPRPLEPCFFEIVKG